MKRRIVDIEPGYNHIIYRYIYICVCVCPFVILMPKLVMSDVKRETPIKMVGIIWRGLKITW